MNDEIEMTLNGVGQQTASKLARLKLKTVADLLFHWPYKYQDRTQIQSIRSLIPENEVVVEVIIQKVTLPMRGRTKLLCEVSDATPVTNRPLLLRFFHVLPFQKKQLQVGVRLRCYGLVRMGVSGLEMFHPEFQILHPAKKLAIENYLTPFYPATEGLSQSLLRKLTNQALNWMERQPVFEDYLPPQLLSSNWPTLKHAIQIIHRPEKKIAPATLAACQSPAQQRLIFEELLVHRISLLQMKQQFQAQCAAPLPATDWQQRFKEQLPYSLTNAQERVIAEIAEDLKLAKPMLRLVQGDVGCGKTIVAAMAMLQAIAHDRQALIMAPTELLAEQHYAHFSQWFSRLAIPVVFLSSKIKGLARKKVLAAIASGEAKAIIGTHALFQAEVTFAHLSLIVVDEQHRFGVQQRAVLREKGFVDEQCPHQLIMTATPIPRTLAMSFYADLDCSQIDELPPGRTPIKTTVLHSHRRDEIIQRVKQVCEEGKQVYWVCPFIEASEVISAESATEMIQQLQLALPELKVGLIHGKISAAEKDKVMQAFKNGELHLLVATTVIEVGVDVPNASVMVIENAERLGLSQLHQLRGRVGRGKVASHCILLYQYPLSAHAKERLQVMRETTDGFVIAERDLSLRGPGEVLGTRQTGELSFKIADLARDAHLLSDVQRIADIVMRDYPHLIEPLMRRWLQGKETYARV